MEIQYIVGLCCLRSHPEAVEIVLGNLVWDSAAEEARDVDVTIRYQGREGETGAFIGLEVNRRRWPLGTPQVEQLAAKLRDMRSISHRAIVSGSGFTKPAIRKARHHGVDLYELVPWETPITADFSALTLEGTHRQALVYSTNSLEFLGDVEIICNPHLASSKEPTPLPGNTPLFTEAHLPHPEFRTIDNLGRAAVQQIQARMRMLPEVERRLMAPIPYPPSERPDGPIGEPLPVDVTLGVPPGVFIQRRGEMAPLTTLQLKGVAQLMHASIREASAFIMRNMTTRQAFAGAKVAPLPGIPGLMMAVTVIPDSSHIGVHPIQLTQEQQHQLQQLILHRSK